MKDKVIYENKEFLNADINDQSIIITEVGIITGMGYLPSRVDASLTLYDNYRDKFNLNLGFDTPNQFREVMRNLDVIKKNIDELQIKMREAEKYLDVKKNKK